MVPICRSQEVSGTQPMLLSGGGGSSTTVTVEPFQVSMMRRPLREVTLVHCLRRRLRENDWISSVREGMLGSRPWDTPGQITWTDLPGQITWTDPPGLITWTDLPGQITQTDPPGQITRTDLVSTQHTWFLCVQPAVQTCPLGSSPSRPLPPPFGLSLFSFTFHCALLSTTWPTI